MENMKDIENQGNQEEVISISVSATELNIIWLWLWKLPYEQSYKLIAKLIKQYNDYKTQNKQIITNNKTNGKNS